MTNKDRIAEGKRLLARCEERIANGKRIQIEAYRERDMEGWWLAKMGVRKNETFKARLLADLEELERKDLNDDFN